jgi:hypothetical protein
MFPEFVKNIFVKLQSPNPFPLRIKRISGDTFTKSKIPYLQNRKGIGIKNYLE